MKTQTTIDPDRIAIQRQSLQAQIDLLTGKITAANDQRDGITERLNTWRDCAANEKARLETALDAEEISLPTIPEPLEAARLRLSAKVGAIAVIEKLLAIWPAREAFITSQIIEAQTELKEIEATISRHERELADVEAELSKLA
jgi:chromosome segregation ATPase